MSKKTVNDNVMWKKYGDHELIYDNKLKYYNIILFSDKSSFAIL